VGEEINSIRRTQLLLPPWGRGTPKGWRGPAASTFG
jgi:hypothetical protein